MTGDAVPREAGHLLVAADGRYLDADPRALDMFGVTLDVLRSHVFGDFAPQEFRELARSTWDDWVASGDPTGEGEGTLVRPDGSMIRVAFVVRRQDDGTFLLIGTPVDEPPLRPHAVVVADVLSHWRHLERRLAEVPPDDPHAEILRVQIDAVREEYRRRTDRQET